MISKEWLLQFRSVDPATQCWNWTRSKNTYGYGVIGRTTKRGRWAGTQYVSRIAFMLWIGPIPEGMLVCHHCDNRACFNPDHLFIGTHKDNQQDMVRKGRVSEKRRLNAAKIDKSDVPKVRSMYQEGISQSVIGMMFGLCQSAVSRIVTRSNWRTVS